MDKNYFTEENKDFLDLTLKFLNDEINQSEFERLTNWIEDSRSNREMFERTKSLWMASSQIQQTDRFDHHKALVKLNKRITAYQIQSHRSKSISIRRLINYAALLVMFIVIGLLSTYIYINSKESPGGLMYVYTPKGSKTYTVLPDGTKIWLNAGSNIIYDAKDFNVDNREVILSGEGFFDVTSNEEKPFIVNAKDIKIKAFGTKFNVKAYPEEDNIQAILISGIVEVEGRNRSEEFNIKLKPNQVVSLATGEVDITPEKQVAPDLKELKSLKNIKVEKAQGSEIHDPVIQDIVAPDLYTSWKDEDWIFKGIEIGELMVLLERRYDIEIEIQSPELNSYKFTGTFRNETIEQVMQVLKLTTPMRYTLDKGKVTIKIDDQLKQKYERYM